MEWLSSPEAWIALVTLTALELVLGIDNIIFISILAGKLPPDQRNRARLVGLGLAMISRLALLFSLAWVIQLTAPWFTVLSNEISGRDFILIVGGFFLIAKSTHEIHQKLEGDEAELSVARAPSFQSVIIQIMLLDVVFSLDSVITAIGMASHLWIMTVAIVIAVGIMMVASHSISRFIDQHPTLKVLALSFLLMIGVMLIGEGLEFHIPKGYMYFAMAFSVCVEMLNLKIRRKTVSPIKLRQRYVEE